MLKSYVSFCLALYRAILADCTEQGITSRLDAERDLSRLQLLAESRGLGLFTIDLPALGKHLDQCLSSGLFLNANVPLSRGNRKSGNYPRLFMGIFQKVFSPDGMLKPDVDVVAVQGLRQLCYAGKKLRVQCHDSKTFDTVRAFYDIDQSIQEPLLSWDADSLDDPDDGEQCLFDLQADNSEVHLEEAVKFPSTVFGASLLDCIQLVADVVVAEFGWFDPSKVRFKHGPGAVADQQRWQNKYLFPHWPAKLEYTFPLADYAFYSWSEWGNAVSNEGAEGFATLEVPSQLIAVPKTQKGPRLIAKEPIANQWCQQALLSFLSERLEDSCLSSAIKLRNQEPSRQLALDASRTDSHWTIDLSEASDRISCWLVERIFRSNRTLLEAFHSVRTKCIINEVDKKSPYLYELRKFSTMGSALTFPVQSIIFAIVSIACVAFRSNWDSRRGITKRMIRSWAREVQVFGDDIIVPSHCGTLVTEALTCLGLKVNVSKTFRSGRFRESCGMDAFMGHDVTPAYVLALPEESKPESLISLVETSRNFAMRGFWGVASELRSIGRQRRLQNVATTRIGSGVFGWPGLEDETSRKRWNSHTQTWEHLCLVPVSRQAKHRPEDSTGLLQYFTEAPEPTTKWSMGVSQRPRLHLKPRWVSSLSFTAHSYSLARKWDVSRLALSVNGRGSSGGS